MFQIGQRRRYAVLGAIAARGPLPLSDLARLVDVPRWVLRRDLLKARRTRYVLKTTNKAGTWYSLGSRCDAQGTTAACCSEHSESSAPGNGPRFEDPQAAHYRDVLTKIRIRVMQVCDFDSTESAAPQDETFAREMDELNTYVRELTDGMEL